MATKKKFGIGIFLFAMLLTGIVLVSAVSAQEELKVIHLYSVKEFFAKF
jgi:hypothetical protein